MLTDPSVVVWAALAVLITAAFLLSMPARLRRRRMRKRCDRMATTERMQGVLRHHNETDDQLRTRIQTMYRDKVKDSTPPLYARESEQIRKALTEKPAIRPDKDLFLAESDYI